MTNNEKPPAQAAAQTDAYVGLPQTPHSALTPEGEIEQFGKIAAGAHAHREGWRKVVVRAGAALLIAAAVALLIVSIYSR